MKYYLTAIVSFIFCLHANAQEYQLQDNEVKGKIIMNDGQELIGYIRLNGGETRPWDNKEKVEFFTEEATADGRVRNKEVEKYKPKDIKAYVAGDQYYESMKISEAKLDLGVGIPAWKFVERIVDGPISYYHIYETPDLSGYVATEEQRVERQQMLERHRTEPMLVLIKGDEEAVAVSNTDLAAYLSECPEVKSKYVDGGYGIDPIATDRKSKLGKWAANAADAKMVMGVLKEIIVDYNNCVQK